MKAKKKIQGYKICLGISIAALVIFFLSVVLRFLPVYICYLSAALCFIFFFIGSLLRGIQESIDAGYNERLKEYIKKQERKSKSNAVSRLAALKRKRKFYIFLLIGGFFIPVFLAAPLTAAMGGEAASIISSIIIIVLFITSIVGLVKTKSRLKDESLSNEVSRLSGEIQSEIDACLKEINSGSSLIDIYIVLFINKLEKLKVNFFTEYRERLRMMLKTFPQLNVKPVSSLAATDFEGFEYPDLITTIFDYNFGSVDLSVNEAVIKSLSDENLIEIYDFLSFSAKCGNPNAAIVSPRGNLLAVLRMVSDEILSRRDKIDARITVYNDFTEIKIDASPEEARAGSGIREAMAIVRQRYAYGFTGVSASVNGGVITINNLAQLLGIYGITVPKNGYIGSDLMHLLIKRAESERLLCMAPIMNRLEKNVFFVPFCYPDDAENESITDHSLHLTANAAESLNRRAIYEHLNEVDNQNRQMITSVIYNDSLDCIYGAEGYHYAEDSDVREQPLCLRTIINNGRSYLCGFTDIEQLRSIYKDSARVAVMTIDDIASYIDYDITDNTNGIEGIVINPGKYAFVMSKPLVSLMQGYKRAELIDSRNERNIINGTNNITREIINNIRCFRLHRAFSMSECIKFAAMASRLIPVNTSDIRTVFLIDGDEKVNITEQLFRLAYADSSASEAEGGDKLTLIFGDNDCSMTLERDSDILTVEIKNYAVPFSNGQSPGLEALIRSIELAIEADK